MSSIIFRSNSYVLVCLSDEKVMISKIIVELLLKSIPYVFYYFKSNSYVLYCLSEKVIQKVRISKITVEISLKSNSYVFYYFKSNSYVLYCLSDKKSEDFKNNSWNFVNIEFVCFLVF